jgi:hypothetical protein
MNRRETLAGTAITLGISLVKPQEVRAAKGAQPPARDVFTPGEPWLDTSGKPIQAHGGSLIQVGTDFLWYGENKEYTTGKTDIWTWGIRCYRSVDLYNWTAAPPTVK